MKNIIVILLLLSSTLLIGQTKKVLFEEFTGNTCGQCPKGNHITDSLLNTYPDVIGVSLHTYHYSDSMFFPEIDTIDQAFANGAPTATTDRVIGPSIWTTWPSDMQTRLLEIPKVSISLNATWNSTSRLISTNINCNILQNLPAGDYRFNLYVVEDSVIGFGAGYDQSNIENTFPGSLFFGLGDPIVGYVHRHVARALLPHAWGEGGIITTSPTVGQSFNTSLNYNLAPSYDENKIKLVAFVTKYTSNHLGDEVLNAEEVDLNLTTSSEDNVLKGITTISPNPTSGNLSISLEEVFTGSYILRNSLGQIVLSDSFEASKELDISLDGPPGIYFLLIEIDGQVITKKVVKK